MSNIEHTFRSHLFSNPNGIGYLDYVKLAKRLRQESNEKNQTLAIMRSCTLEPIQPALEVELASIGIKPEITFLPFNQFEEQLLDPGSQLHGLRPENLWIHATMDAFCPDLVATNWNGDSTSVANLVHATVARFSNILENASKLEIRRIVVSALLVPDWFPLGIADQRSKTSLENAVREINAHIRDICETHMSCFFFDINQVAHRKGTENILSSPMQYTADLPYSHSGLIAIAQNLKTVFSAVAGKTTKCIVVDLDNTLWGGIVGERGASGVEIGPDRPGRPYQKLQQILASFQSRGILLAIASKNNEPDAMEVFTSNRNMLLRLADFSAHRINWNPKPQSVREIAEELNIGVDSITFIDDNPAEREQMRQMLPEVFTPEIPADPAVVPDYISKLFCFERYRITQDDTKRVEMYRQQSQRNDLKRTSTSLEDYYRSLEMQMTIATNSPEQVHRVAQLTQKTNQFNTSNLRLTEADIQNRMKSGKHWVISASLKDRFGDNGQISALLVHFLDDGKTAEIELFLMSCRVIGRTAENALLTWLLNEIKQSRRATRVSARFVPSKRNQVSAKTLPDFGFMSKAENSFEWNLEHMPIPEMKPWFQITKAGG